MYRGFNLELEWFENEYYEIGKNLFNLNSFNIQLTLDDLISNNGTIDGSKMQENWFPQIEADIFISHSHKDEETAITLAGWLENTFGIKAFIDSCIWDYSDDLLKEIDNKYCKNVFGNTYNYRKRNLSTSHVHMMLTTAINMMIDKTECLIFLNTPNSITPVESINKTKSPWIYSEITISQLIRKRKKEAHRQQLEKAFVKLGRLNEDLEISYDLNLEHLFSIDINDLVKWEKKWDNELFYYTHALDVLYDLKPPLLLD